jgi:hypothetical protein
VHDAEHTPQLAAEIAALREQTDVIDERLLVVSREHADGVESLGLSRSSVDRRAGHHG